MFQSFMRTLLLAVSIAAASGLTQAAPSGGSIPAASAKHSIVLHGTDIPYTVAWSELALPVGSPEPDATISATSYIREGDPSPARPVIFAFNGGPGASSTPLHFGLLGPRTRKQPPGSTTTQFVDNPDSLLDVADLVLVDPVGTGFSRELRPGGNAPYLSVPSDAKAAEALVRQWLDAHGRTHAPLVLIGESYGATRVATLEPLLAELDVRGLVLISPMIDGSAAMTSGTDPAYISELPSLAVTAAFHRRTNFGQQPAEQVFEAAREFAQGPFASALQMGSELPAAARDRLAGQVAALIGLPAAAVSRYNLRVPSQDFLEQLLPGQVIGRIDTRVAGPAQTAPLVAGRSKAADDPALNMGASNVMKSPSARQYFTNEVGVMADIDYVALSLDLNFAWDWRSTSRDFDDNVQALNAAPNLVAFMRSRPAARLFVAASYYDLATPALATRYTLTHTAVAPERTIFKTYAAGHAPYDDDASRHIVAEDLRTFLASALTAASDTSQSAKP